MFIYSFTYPSKESGKILKGRCRAVFRTLPNCNDGVFMQKYNKKYKFIKDV